MKVLEPGGSDMWTRMNRPGRGIRHLTGRQIGLRCLVLLILLSAAPAGAQTLRRIEGRVSEADSLRPLPAANIIVLGTNRGTISNREGDWLLLLPEGPASLVFRYVGFRSDTLRVAATGDVRFDAVLEPIVLENPPLIVYGADPARAILRRAIAARDSLRAGLESYRFEAYTRGVISREDSIAGISESFTTGYWRRGDPLREEIVQRRTTVNLPEMTRFQGVLGHRDFSQDDVEVASSRYLGPLHPDALTWYRPELLETTWQDGTAVYRIGLEPTSYLIPLLRGEIWIADGSWALVGVDLTPGETVTIPFTDDVHLHYRQGFRRQQEGYWLPAEMRLEMGASFHFGPVTFPRIGFDQTSIIYAYEINPILPDSLFERFEPIIAQPSAATIDSAFWQENDLLPLTGPEQAAYTKLDSTQTLDRLFAPRAMGRTLPNELGTTEDSPLLDRLLSGLDFWYNRVEGTHLGCRLTTTPVDGPLTVTARGGKALSAGLWTWEAGAALQLRRELAPGPSGIGRAGVSFNLSRYDRVAGSPDAGFYPPLVNGFLSALTKADYRDYHRARGKRVGLTIGHAAGTRLELYGARERHAALAVVTNWSLLRRSELARSNPIAEEGAVERLGLVLTIGRPESNVGIITGRGLRLWAERGEGDFSGGKRNWYRADGVLSFALPTWTGRWIFPPQLVIRAAGGWSQGPLPVQLWGAPETALASYGPLGCLRAAEPREFAGTRYAVVTAEHNFRSFPFLLLGLRALSDRGFELIVHGAVAGARRELPDGSHLRLPQQGVYGEAGLGLGRIEDLFRVDLTRRLTGSRCWVLTLAFTTFF
jgi:hypothetical protein